MTFAEYQALDGINASAIKAGALSMKHMHAVMTGVEKEQTTAMRWGSIVHKAILERAEFFRRVSVFEGYKKGKDWESFKAEHDPEWILSSDEHAKLFALSAAVHANKDAHRLIEGTGHEVTAAWNDQDYGQAKSRLDGFSERFGMLELKTARLIAPELFAKQFVKMGYDLQCGWYCEGAQLSKMSKDIPACHVIAIESVEPFDVAVYTIPRMVIDVGRSKARKIARAYRIAEAAGIFEGVAEGITDLVMPSWYGEKDVMNAFAEMSAEDLGIE